MQRPEFIGIQYLRGAAAVAVVVFHLSGKMADMGVSAYPSSSLQSGVDVFFIISGFVMYYSTAGGTRVTAGSFLFRRITRIAPLYWLATLLMVVVMLIAPQVVAVSRLDILHVGASLIFAPFRNPATPVYLPLVTPGWTLNYEMFFYLVFAVAIILAKRSEAGVVAIVSIVLAALSLGGLITRFSGVAGFYFNPVVLEFLFGIGVGIIVKRWQPRTTAFMVPLMILGAVALVVPPTGDMYYRSFRFGVAGAVVVLAAAYIRWPSIRLLHVIGDASYSLYLSHFFVVSAFFQLWRHLHLSNSTLQIAVFFCVGTASAVAAAIAIWWFIERPLIALTHLDAWPKLRRQTLKECLPREAA